MAPDAESAGPGCLIQILGIFLQAIGIAVVLLLLLPILLGTASTLSWQAVEPLGFIAVRSGIFAMILVTIVSLFPYIGPLLASSPGVEAFLLCWLTFRFLSPLYLHVGTEKETAGLFPPWWIVVTLILFSFLLSRLMTLAVVGTGNKLKGKGILGEKSYRWWVEVIGPSLDILGGILPFLYYARWVALYFTGA